MKRILFLRHQPTYQPWYVENHIEYIIRYLGHKYHFDIGLGIKNNYPDGYLPDFYKDPDDYDLLVSLFTPITHMEEPEKYFYKMAGIVWETEEIHKIKGICYASTNRITDNYLLEHNIPFVKTRIGIDTQLFQPIRQAREDNLLHVGFVGKAHSPRKQVKELLMPLTKLEGVRLMFYSQQPLPEKEIEYCGGKEFFDCLEGGNKAWTGMPNIYNNLDVLIETDADVSVSFPTLEAAACGVPSICTYGGLSQDLVDAKAAIHIIPDSYKDTRLWAYENTSEVAQKIKEAVIWMRDHQVERQMMGLNARKEAIKNWTWDKWILEWDSFFEKSLFLVDIK